MCSKVIVERARLRQLAWGNQAHMQALKREYPGGFDIILGSDIVYVDSFVPDLFATAVALLSPHSKVKSQPMLYFFALQRFYGRHGDATLIRTSPVLLRLWLDMIVHSPLRVVAYKLGCV